MKPPSGPKKQTQFKPCPERSRMGQFQNTTPKQWEEKKGLWEAAEKAILLFYVAKMILFRAKYIPSSLY